MKKRVSKIISNPYRVVPYLSSKGFLKPLPDKIYLKLMYRALLNKRLDIENPKTFSEKLQWLKINDRNPLYTDLVDKYEARKYIEKVIGKDYLIPILGIYNSFDEIDFDDLPNEFVLKSTHDSGGVVICRDKNNFDKDEAKRILNGSLKRNYYYWGREWPYKKVKHRILCEAMIKTEDGRAPIDYKFHCFNGEPDNVMLCLDRENGNTKFYFFNEKWEFMRYTIDSLNEPEDFTLPKPKMMDEMFRIARELSKGFKFVRVDLYCEKDKIYCGELTFFPASGFNVTLLKDVNMLLGDKLDITK